MAIRRINRGDKLKLRTTGDTLEALGEQTNSGEVFVRAKNRRHPFFVLANMVEIVETETEGSTENEIS